MVLSYLRVKLIMKETLLVAVLCICGIATTFVSGFSWPNPKCPKNSTYSQCRGCQKSCFDMYLDRTCTLKCESGCTCDSGLVRNEDGKCVHPAECKDYEIRCPANLEYNKCAKCFATCEGRHCDNKCHVGCFCPRGLVYNKDLKRCVTKKECCPKNSHYEECGSACPKTCKNMYTQKSCTDKCVPGCVCDSLSVKNNKGECVDPWNCMEDVDCPRGRIFARCGACPNKCGDLYSRRASICPAVCSPGCVCDPSLVETKNGECVLAQSCPREEIECEENLEYQTCAGCEKSCTDGDEPKACTAQCRVGCFCPKGLYYDNKTNTCVTYKEDCSNSYQSKDCWARDPNSVFKTCGSCNPTCFNRHPACTLNCQPGCKCQEGYVEDPNGKCIEPSQCPIE